jgi:hypothetical protein
LIKKCLPLHVRPFLLISNPLLQTHVGTPLSIIQLCEHPKLEQVLLNIVGKGVDVVGDRVPKISGRPEGCGSRQ